MKRLVTMVCAAFVLTLSAAAQAAPVERRLYPERVEASTFLWNDWNRFQENYHPNYIADDDPKTAWTEGAEGSGAGEWVRVIVTELDGSTKLRLRLRNGYHKSKSLFARNARAKEVTIKLLPGGKEKKFTLKDDMNWQDVVLDQPTGKLSGFEIKANSVYEGTHYADLCISDLQVFVTSSTVNNPSFEKSKLKRLLDWKSERVKAAATFKQQSGKALPIAPQYRGEDNGGETPRNNDCDGTNRFCNAGAGLAAARTAWPDRKAAIDTAEAAIKANFAGWHEAVVRVSDKRAIPQVDGIRIPQPIENDWAEQDRFDMPMTNQLGYLQASQLARVVADKKKSLPLDKMLKAELPQCKKRGQVSTAVWSPPPAKGADGDRLTALLLVACSTYEERDGEYPYAGWQLLVYDNDGNLSLLISDGYVNALTWKKGGAPTLELADRVQPGANRRVFKAVSAIAKN